MHPEHVGWLVGYASPVLARRRYVHSGAARWRRPLAVIVGVLVVLGAVGVGVYLLVDSLSDNETQRAPAPSVVVHEHQAPAAQDLGFPAFATKNTTRVAGLDPVAD